MADDPPPQEKLAQQILSGGPFVSEATQAVGKLFQATFAALSQDLETVIKSKKSSDTLSPVIDRLSIDMINLLRDRIEAVFGATATASQDTAMSHDTAASPPPKEPGTPT